MWIAIEGVDGAGKRTQAALLQERLQRHGLAARIISFPRYGETVFARSIADYLNGRFGALHSIDPHLAALLYAGDRAESRTLLETAAAESDVLILDRYIASNLAYQGARIALEARGAFIDWLAEIEHTAYGLRRADLTLLLDVPVGTASRNVARKGARDYTDKAADIHEQDLAFLREVRRVYHQLAAARYGSAWTVIPCMDPCDALLEAGAIHEAIWSSITPLLAARNGRPVHP
jgi:dTMP kinase